MNSARRLTIKQLNDMNENRLNINSKKWGEPGWIFSFACAFGYPKQPTNEEKNDAERFFTSFKTMLSCYTCRNNYKKHLNDLPLTDEVLSSRINLTKWLVNIKNVVNKSQGLSTYGYDETITYYYNLLNKPKTLCIKTLIEEYLDDSVLKMTILISILLFLFYLLKRN